MFFLTAGCWPPFRSHWSLLKIELAHFWTSSFEQTADVNCVTFHLRQAGRGLAVPIRAELEAHLGVFGPEELRNIADAFEAALKDLGLTDRKDPVTLMLAKLTIELAKQGQFTAASLRARVMREMKPKGRLN
jgi:hypothetical protein